MPIEHTLNIIENQNKKNWSVFTSNGTNPGGARQYSFDFRKSRHIRTTLSSIFYSKEQ